MRVSELLKAKGSSVVTIKAEALVGELVGDLTRRNIGALVVSNDGSTVEGIVSERDVVRALNQFGGAILDRPVGALCSTDVQTCSPDDAVDSLMATMTNHHIRHIPVVENGILVGIVSIGDVVKTRLEELEKDRAELVNYIEAR